MKKQFFTAIALVAIIISMASCGKTYEAKDVTLKNQNDSLNYAFGVANGGMIKNYYLANDSTGKGIVALMDAFSDALAVKADKGEIYKTGVQIGTGLKQMQKDGFLGEKSLKLNLDIVKQGLINGIYEKSEGFDHLAAETYLNTTMQNIQQEKAVQQTPAPAINE
ncbi:MAG: hypothetical protein LBN23_02450 [Paludibacter sp.]|jgi:FKBP-type peptidyl-prolyl cis-trans isomerase FklB|nr:hypothetical protein [Paludibacter sp.]